MNTFICYDRCGTCKKAEKWLKDKGIAYIKRPIKEENPTYEELKAWQEEGSIQYLGATDDVRPYIASAGVLVLPSYREGLPVSIMEGMSMGRPAVVADAPGSRDLVQAGVNGFLVPVRDAAALAAGMEKFIVRPELVTVMGESARRLAETQYDSRLVAADLIERIGLAKTPADD